MSQDRTQRLRIGDSECKLFFLSLALGRNVKALKRNKKDEMVAPRTKNLPHMP